MTGFTLNPSATVLLTDLGISVPNVLRRASLHEVTFTEASATLTVAQYYALWRALDEEADDPHLPIRIGTAISAEAFDPPIFAALCSPDLKLAAARIAQYKKLIGPLRLAINSLPGTTTTETDWPHGSNPASAGASASWTATHRRRNSYGRCCCGSSRPARRRCPPSPANSPSAPAPSNGA